MSDRIKIREAMDQGNIDLVTQMINDFDPELLDMKPTLYFHLQQQKLIELIRSSLFLNNHILRYLNCAGFRICYIRIVKFLNERLDSFVQQLLKIQVIIF